MEYHNFMLVNYLGKEAISVDQVFNETMEYAKRILPLVADVSYELKVLRDQGSKVMFEGAQGTQVIHHLAERQQVRV